MKTFIAHISKSPLTKLCRLFFLLSTAVAITACTGKNNVIDITPENSLEWMSVYQLERSDTATLLKGNVYGQPGEQVRIPADMFLKDRATGTEYRLKGSPDFKTGENVEMPEGITLPFTLAFEPLQKNATLLDLVCGKESIRGIHTTAPKSRYVTTITGTFHGRPNAARLVLLPAEADFRTTPYISIPVKDGKFCYKLHTDIATAYDLIAWDELLSRGWYTTTLFSDGGTTEVEYYPTEEDKAPQVVRTTSKAGKELGHYKEKVMELTQEERLRSLSDSLWSNDLFYSEQYKQLLNEAQKQNTQEAWEKFYSFRDTDEALSAEGKAFKEMSDSLHNIQRQYTTAYSREKQDIVGFYLIFREYFWEEDSTTKAGYRQIFDSIYAAKYPGHPFTEKMHNMIASDNIRPGGHFIDFTAPDVEGTMHTLSHEIKGKTAVINLWASWCGPCRRHGMELIPIYNEYKDKGFTVVGAARESENAEAMKAAVAKDGYPWLNLVEINDAGRIWQKYGADNGGGKIILVDRNGTIVAVNPTASEVQLYLEKHLQ